MNEVKIKNACELEGRWRKENDRQESRIDTVLRGRVAWIMGLDWPWGWDWEVLGHCIIIYFGSVVPNFSAYLFMAEESTFLLYYLKKLNKIKISLFVTNKYHYLLIIDTVICLLVSIIVYTLIDSDTFLYL